MKAINVEDIFESFKKLNKCKGCKMINQGRNNLICKNCKK